MESRKLNRKQRRERAKLRNAAFNFESFVTADWTIQDWEKLPSPLDGWTANGRHHEIFHRESQSRALQRRHYTPVLPSCCPTGNTPRMGTAPRARQGFARGMPTR